MLTVSVLDQFFDPLAGWLTPQTAQQILAWQPSAQVKERLLVLGRRANDGELTPEEDAEYEQLIEEGDAIALWQAKARRILN